MTWNGKVCYNYQHSSRRSLSNSAMPSHCQSNVGSFASSESRFLKENANRRSILTMIQSFITLSVRWKHVLFISNILISTTSFAQVLCYAKWCRVIFYNAELILYDEPEYICTMYKCELKQDFCSLVTRKSVLWTKSKNIEFQWFQCSIWIHRVHLKTLCWRQIQLANF